MGKFDGVLIASDFDNTIVYTEDSLYAGAPTPDISPENRAAIEHFMAGGGTFCVATGRAKPSFEPIRRRIPSNGPTILFNGAAIYDFRAEKYLCTAFLPETVRGHLARLAARFPQIGVELYHDDNSIHALHANDVTRRHMHLTHAPSIAIDAVEEAPSPISKAVFSAPEEEMHALYAYVQTLPWFGEYEIVQSSPLLMELTVRGANKGGMAARLIELLHIAPENFYCIGDHANDIPMLRLAHIPFAPANAIAPVRQVPGIRVLPDCRENALAEIVRQLGELYKMHPPRKVKDLSGQFVSLPARKHRRKQKLLLTNPRRGDTIKRQSCIG